MMGDSKCKLLKELEDEYMKQFPNSYNPSKSMFEFGIDDLIEGYQNRNGKKIRIVYQKFVCDGGKIEYYTPKKIDDLGSKSTK
jgi:hypothetical protein